MKIITVTLNPSLDRTLIVHYLGIGYHNNAAEPARLDAAGRGMNLSRALHLMKGQTRAVVLLGDDPISRSYEALVVDEAFPVKLIRYAGSIRSNIFIKDTGNDNETVIKEPGSEVPAEAMQQTAEFLESDIEDGDYVVFAGALSMNMAPDTYARLAEVAKKAGARVIVDTSGEALREALKASPDLVTLSQLQTERYFNFPVRSTDDVMYCARKLCESGAKTTLIKMKAHSGALYYGTDGQYLIEFPEEMESGTYTGTYDALLAGYLVGLKSGNPFQYALKLGAAAAIYTAAQVGNAFGTLDDIRANVKKAVVTPAESTSAITQELKIS